MIDDMPMHRGERLRILSIYPAKDAEDKIGKFVVDYTNLATPVARTRGFKPPLVAYPEGCNRDGSFYLQDPKHAVFLRR